VTVWLLTPVDDPSIGPVTDFACTNPAGDTRCPEAAEYLVNYDAWHDGPDEDGFDSAGAACCPLHVPPGAVLAPEIPDTPTEETTR
jgi:hypothetical protein